MASSAWTGNQKLSSRFPCPHSLLPRLREPNARSFARGGGGGVHFESTWALATPTPVGTRVSITFGSEVFGSRGLRSPGDLQSTLRQW